MLTLRLINEQTEQVVAALEKKHFPAAQEAIAQVQRLDNQRRSAQQALDSTKQEINTLSRQIGQLMREGQHAAAAEARQQVARLKERSTTLARDESDSAEQLRSLLAQIPNIAYDAVPAGAAAADNWVVRSNIKDCVVGRDTVGNWTARPAPRNDSVATPLPHWDIARTYHLIDFDLGVKIAGAGFPVYTGQGAQLQRALINFFLDEARRAGYREVMPPTVVGAASGYATGQLPDKEGQMYHCTDDDLYLIPTAEVPVTNIYRDVILDESALPQKCCAYTECFRREAGSYGKDVRGLNRLHEFAKVEIVRVDSPAHAAESHREMVEHVEGLLQKLELPYRVVRLCGADISFTAALCYDFEVYAAAQQRWLEVSSVSTFDTYQANRLHCRYRHADTKKVELCHTLNGSALALPRVVAALLENNQTPEGIRLPQALVPYMGRARLTP